MIHSEHTVNVCTFNLHYSSNNSRGKLHKAGTYKAKQEKHKSLACHVKNISSLGYLNQFTWIDVPKAYAMNGLAHKTKSRSIKTSNHTALNVALFPFKYYLCSFL